MLVGYILRHLYTRFAVSFIALLGVLVTADLLMRLPSLPSMAFVPPLFLFALPVVSLFAIPISASIAVQTTIGQWHGESATQLFEFFSGMRSDLWRALILFTCSLGVLYLPLVFDVAPRSMQAAKGSVAWFAKAHIRGLEVGVFHQLAPGCMVYFASKELAPEGSELLFKNILIRYADAKGIHTLSAQEGLLRENKLNLLQGTMHTKVHEKQLCATFGSMYFDLDRLFRKEQGLGEQRQRMGHLVWKDLRKEMDEGTQAVAEFHARLARLLWLLVFPFLALAGMQLFAGMRLVGSIAWSSGLFLFSYVLISLAAALKGAALLTPIVLYGVSCVLCGFIFYYARGKR